MAETAEMTDLTATDLLEKEDYCALLNLWRYDLTERNFLTISTIEKVFADYPGHRGDFLAMRYNDDNHVVTMRKLVETCLTSQQLAKALIVHLSEEAGSCYLIKDLYMQGPQGPFVRGTILFEVRLTNKVADELGERRVQEAYTFLDNQVNCDGMTDTCRLSKIVDMLIVHHLVSPEELENFSSQARCQDHAGMLKGILSIYAGASKRTRRFINMCAFSVHGCLLGLDDCPFTDVFIKRLAGESAGGTSGDVVDVLQ